MTIKFSRVAEYKLERLVQFLSQEWSDQISDKFLEKLNRQLIAITNHPFAFPESQLKPGVRKCTITKQTVMYYEVGKEEIIVLTLTDTRQNPKTILQEIRNNLL